ncbi:hypothetical protein ABC347_11465 [Sphingomonas sp. 1P06PA]|uniref:hypothetical protein n=1 Tax=Sphingomonas sp. 1P06PA TaxID=554121 RepID=UPI0039A5B142
MILTMIALMIAPAEATESYAATTPLPTSASTPARAAAPNENENGEICRRRMVVGTGLIGGLKQKKICKTAEEWAELGKRGQ